jgi:hypothetical protein
MEKSSQIAWNIVPLRHFFPLKVVPLIEVLLYAHTYEPEMWILPWNTIFAVLEIESV